MQKRSHIHLPTCAFFHFKNEGLDSFRKLLPILTYFLSLFVSTANNGGGYTFSGFTGLPTTTGGYYPVPSGSGGSGSGSGSNKSNSGSSDKGSSNTGLYAGIGAGVGVVVLGIALFLWRRSSKNKKSSTKTTELPSPPPMQAVYNQHQQPPQPPLPAAPVHYNHTAAPIHTEYQQQQQYQNQQQQQQTNQYHQQYQEQQQNPYTPPTVVPPQQQQYTAQPPVATNYYPQAQGGGGGYPDPNAYADPNQQQHQGYYPTVSNAAPHPQPVPSPTFAPNDYHQQQQVNTFSPVVTTSGITHQEPMPMPEQSNPYYGITSPSATTNTTAYSPAMTTSNTTAYETPATTGFVYEAPASIVPPPVPAAVNSNVKVSSHGPQEIHAYSQEQAASGLPKNPQYVDPQHNNGNNYHN